MAAALLALLMLSHADVKSAVMQAAMADPARMAPICMGPMAGGGVAMAMPGMSLDPTPALHLAGHKSGHGRKASCPYCSAAAHAPILGGVAPLRVATAFTFAAYRTVSSHGPRGPPARQPRARGPPTDPVLL
jgi:hypothetical protein